MTFTMVQVEHAIFTVCLCSAMLGALYSTEDESCSTGKYGDGCTKSCSAFCKNDTCHGLDGACTDGCQPGCSDSTFCCVNTTFCARCSSPSHCAECITGRYGGECQLSCPDDCLGPCFITTGDCFECKPNHYGRQCHDLCSNNCIDLQNGSSSLCDRLTGECSECVYNHFGKFCGSRCPANCRNNHTQPVCSKESGECLNGCKDGTYGKKCENLCSFNCKDNSCKAHDGVCLSCQGDTFGSFCALVCSKTCLPLDPGSSSCHQENGSCKLDCILGYQGVFCEIACRDGCKGNTCDRLTGACSGGCLEGRSGKYCDQVEADSFVLKAVVVGLSTAAVTVALVLLIAFVCERCKNKAGRAAASGRSGGSNNQNNYDHLEHELRNNQRTYCDIADLPCRADTRAESHVYSNDHRDSHIYSNTTLGCVEQ